MERSERDELRLLVVEDETIVAMELEDILGDLGHTVLGSAATCEQAISLMETFAEKIDGVFLDANLRGCSAAPVMKELKTRGIPYILASGYGSQELSKQGLEGPQMSKPYHSGEVEKALSVF